MSGPGFTGPISVR